MATQEKTEASLVKKLSVWDREGWRDVVSGRAGTCFTHTGWNAKLWVGGLESSGDGTLPPQAAIDNGPQRRGLFSRADNVVEVITALQGIADKNPGRYNLASILIEWGADAVRLTATDGRKLASINHGQGDDYKTSFHVDARGLAFLVDVLAKHRRGSSRWSNLEFALIDGATPGLALYSEAGAMAIIYQAAGEYPNYRAVLPTLPHSVGITGEFFKAMEVLKGCTSTESQAVRVEVIRHEGKPSLTLRARRLYPRIDSVAVLDAPEWGDTSAEFVAGFDPHYVAAMGALAASLYGSAVLPRLEYKDKDTGVMFGYRPGDVFLVMPIDI